MSHKRTKMKTAAYQHERQQRLVGEEPESSSDSEPALSHRRGGGSESESESHSDSHSDSGFESGSGGRRRRRWPWQTGYGHHRHGTHGCHSRHRDTTGCGAEVDAPSAQELHDAHVREIRAAHRRGWYASTRRALETGAMPEVPALAYPVKPVHKDDAQTEQVAVHFDAMRLSELAARHVPLQAEFAVDTPADAATGRALLGAVVDRAYLPGLPAGTGMMARFELVGDHKRVALTRGAARVHGVRANNDASNVSGGQLLVVEADGSCHVGEHRGADSAAEAVGALTTGEAMALNLPKAVVQQHFMRHTPSNDMARYSVHIPARSEVESTMATVGAALIVRDLPVMASRCKDMGMDPLTTGELLPKGTDRMVVPRPLADCMIHDLYEGTDRMVGRDVQVGDRIRMTLTPTRGWGALQQYVQRADVPHSVADPLVSPLVTGRIFSVTTVRHED